MKHLWAILVLGSAALLGGCGGGGGGDDAPAPVTEQVPADASASIGGFMNYLKALVVSVADTLEPVDVSAVTPPADDTAEPTPVD